MRKRRIFYRKVVRMIQRNWKLILFFFILGIILGLAGVGQVEACKVGQC